MKVLILPPLVCIVFFTIAAIVTSSFDSGDSLVLYQMVAALVVICILTPINVIITLRYKKAERYELKDQVCGILENYVSLIDAHATKDRMGSFLNNKSPRNHSSVDDQARTTLNSGHSHVCIVSVLRDDQWVRLPTLLLVKGDIIALMVR
jgi:hypothetical protein